MSCERSPISRESTPGSAFQAITGGDAEDLRESWNARYQSRAYVAGKETDPFLRISLRLLPKGKTLLFPLEEGSNGVFLAKQGFEVTGIDYSDSALRAAQKLARENEVRLGTVNADLESHDFGVDRYDLIVGLDFYRPRLVEQIKRALKKNGVLLYTVGVATPEQIQKGAVPAHSLRPGELRTLFADFQVIVYDEIPSGPDTPGQQPLARLIARKP